MFIWQDPEWPGFTWSDRRLIRPVESAAAALGLHAGLADSASPAPAAQDLTLAQIQSFSSDSEENRLRAGLGVVSDQSGTLIFSPPAPSMARQELDLFIDWFNTRAHPEGTLRASLSLLWLMALQPLESKNLQAAIGVSNRAIHQTGSPFEQPNLSREGQEHLYQALNDGLDVTDWLIWHLNWLEAEAGKANRRLQRDIREAANTPPAPLSSRQAQLIHQWRSDPALKMTAKMWSAQGRCSLATAQRDLNELERLTLVRRGAGGSKNTHFLLN
jgi:hypothetical protein